jgi:hypothetical protein
VGEEGVRERGERKKEGEREKERREGERKRGCERGEIERGKRKSFSPFSPSLLHFLSLAPLSH